jgi:hypothetical protein
MVITARIRFLLTAFSMTACNVSASAPPTGGVSSEAGGGAGAACDRGTVVLLSDYQSTQIALSTLDGTTQSSAFLSTASTKASALAFALSGDVVLPGTTPASGQVVLLDRFGTNAITWADPATAKVIAQLGVGTGFESNPQDYLEIDATHAYVTRWGINHAPGQQPFDGGNDILVVDTAAHVITGSIALPVEEGLPPRPAGMTRVGDTVLVILQRTSDDFQTVGESALVGVANGAVAWEQRVTGLRGCGRPVLSPSGTTIAVACEGQLAMDGSVTDLSMSAIALYDVTSLPPKPLQRFAIADQLGSPTQAAGGHPVAFASDGVVLGKTQTPLGGMADNQAFELDLASGKATVLATAGKDSMGKGKGAVFGDVVCRPGCGAVCLLADADLGKLRRWNIAADGLHPLADVTVETTTGLPPLLLGGY